MAVQGDSDLFAQRGDDRWADGQVGDEVAIHYVEMEDCAAAVDGLLGIDGKLREVGGEN